MPANTLCKYHIYCAGVPDNPAEVAVTAGENSNQLTFQTKKMWGKGENSPFFKSNQKQNLVCDTMPETKRRGLFKIYRTPQKKEFAKQLRENATSAELLLLSRLRTGKNQPGNLSVNFQKIILGWIADFYIPKAKLIIEVDGKYHEPIEQQKRDAYRARTIVPNGIKILRFTNEQVLNDIDNVLQKIYLNVAQRWIGTSLPWWLEEFKEAQPKYVDLKHGEVLNCKTDEIKLPESTRWMKIDKYLDNVKITTSELKNVSYRRKV